MYSSFHQHSDSMGILETLCFPIQYCEKHIVRITQKSVSQNSFPKDVPVQWVYICVPPLCVLVVLHLFWYYQFILILIDVVTKKPDHLEDTSEEKHGENVKAEKRKRQ